MKSLINRLKKQNKRIAVAESCTGGLAAKRITDIAGASSVFGCGVVSYTNEMKIKLLGVKPETLAEFGAVSENTACEMADGVRVLSGADIAVSVTGLAGPDGDGSGKPIGTVCIGIATEEKCYSTTFVFAGKRSEIRRMAAKMALNMAYDELGSERTKGKREKKDKGLTKKATNAVKKTKKAIGKLIKKEKTIDKNKNQ